MSKIAFLRLYPIFILGTGTFLGTFTIFLGTIMLNMISLK
ncbi:MAG: hypothetical protein RLZZ69_3722 [Cyanobacteriota bacterium]